MDVGTKIYEMLFEDTTHEELMRACNMILSEDGEPFTVTARISYRGPRAVRIGYNERGEPSPTALQADVFVTEVPDDYSDEDVAQLLGSVVVLGDEQRVRFTHLAPGKVVHTY